MKSRRKSRFVGNGKWLAFLKKNIERVSIRDSIAGSKKDFFPKKKKIRITSGLLLEDFVCAFY